MQAALPKCLLVFTCSGLGTAVRGLIEGKHLVRMQSLSKSEHISLARLITATYKPFLQPFDKTQYADDPAVAKLLPCNSGGGHGYCKEQLD